jgi:hypothetical protein
VRRLATLACALLVGIAVCDCTGYDCNGQPITFAQATAQAKANATVNGAPGGTCFTLEPPGSMPQALTGDGGTDGGDAGDVDTDDADAGEDGGP